MANDNNFTGNANLLSAAPWVGRGRDPVTGLPTAESLIYGYSSVSILTLDAPIGSAALLTDGQFAFKFAAGAANWKLMSAAQIVPAGTAVGDLLRWDGAAWINLAAGVDETVLTGAGAGVVPSYLDPGTRVTRLNVPNAPGTVTGALSATEQRRITNMWFNVTAGMALAVSFNIDNNQTTNSITSFTRGAGAGYAEVVPMNEMDPAECVINAGQTITAGISGADANAGAGFLYVLHVRD